MRVLVGTACEVRRVEQTNLCSIGPKDGVLVVQLDGLGVQLYRLVPVVGGVGLVAVVLEGNRLLLWGRHSSVESPLAGVSHATNLEGVMRGSSKGNALVARWFSNGLHGATMQYRNWRKLFRVEWQVPAPRVKTEIWASFWAYTVPVLPLPRDFCANRSRGRSPDRPEHGGARHPLGGLQSRPWTGTPHACRRFAPNDFCFRHATQ